MAAFGQNLKFAARQLLRNPGFTVIRIFTLALSIGANTAIFSIVNALDVEEPCPIHIPNAWARFTRVSPAPGRPMSGTM